jgi:hypothetical protein
MRDRRMMYVRGGERERVRRFSDNSFLRSVWTLWLCSLRTRRRRSVLWGPRFPSSRAPTQVFCSVRMHATLNSSHAGPPGSVRAEVGRPLPLCSSYLFKYTQCTPLFVHASCR